MNEQELVLLLYLEMSAATEQILQPLRNLSSLAAAIEGSRATN